MKNITITTTAMILTVCLSAFAKVNPGKAFIEKDFYRLSFNKIVVEGDIDINLSESTDRQIEISGDEKNVKYVSWKIRDGVLFLSSKSGSLKNKAKVSVNVSQLQALSVKGNSDVTSEGALIQMY